MEGESTPPPQEQGVSTCEHVKPKPPCEKPKSRSLPKKTKLEKSLEVLCDKMVSSSASEMDRYFTFLLHVLEFLFAKAPPFYL